MTEQQIQKLLEAIREIVAADGPWVEKRAAITSTCDEEDKIALNEFIGWFEVEE